MTEGALVLWIVLLTIVPGITYEPCPPTPAEHITY